MRDGPAREVLERARRGDERAFATLVDSCGGLVLNLAWRIVRHRQEAEDLAQEVFVHLLRVLPRYDPNRPFLPWLRRVATNLVLNRISGKARRERRRTASLERIREEAGDAIPDAAAGAAEDRAAARERATLVRLAVRELPADHRAILALRYFGGKTYEELAEALALPMGTVKNRLFRARAALADRLRTIEKEVE